MNDFDFTYKGLIELLSKDGRNTKGTILKALKGAKTQELEKLAHSIMNEVSVRKIQSMYCRNCGRFTMNEDRICDGCKAQDGYRGNDEVHE